MDLDPDAQRILGCLMEKERTVPDGYPLTLNALVTACNQTTNRWPVLRMDSSAVQRTLDALKSGGLVRFVHPSHGERTTKFRQVLDEVLGLDGAESALLCLLLLRGPQTAGELRTRAERLHPFAGAHDVEATLHALAGRESSLAEELSRRPGERETRWRHRLGPAPDGDHENAPSAGALAAPAVADAASGSDPSLVGRVARLEGLVADLYARLGEDPPEDPATAATQFGGSTADT